jgi:hypothetical protein
MILRFKTPSTYPPKTSTAPHKIKSFDPVNLTNQNHHSDKNTVLPLPIPKLEKNNSRNRSLLHTMPNPPA